MTKYKYRLRTEREGTTLKNYLAVMYQDQDHFWKKSRLHLHFLFDLLEKMGKRAIASERILKKVFNDDGTIKLDDRGNPAVGHREIQMELDILKRYQEPFNLTEEDREELRNLKKEMYRNRENNEGGD